MTSEGTLVDLDFGDTSNTQHVAGIAGGAVSSVPNGPTISFDNDTEPTPSVQTLREKVTQLTLVNASVEHHSPHPSHPAPAAAATAGRKDAIVNDLLLPSSAVLLYGTAADDKQSVNNQSSSRLSASSASTVATTIIVDTGDGTPLALPDVSFEGITLDSGIDRESQPLLGSRDHEITYNQFPAPR
uniref:Uncharacterized protein n=1 Tax=Anopheles dirus TaxID=7168 RepID=A0A182N6Q6_9DIPT